MDKSWINILNRLNPLYENGAKEFLHFASLDRPDPSTILCPCRKCRNMKFVRKDLIVEHIVVDGFLNSYTSWIYRGEELFSSKLVNQLDKDDEMQDMLHEAFGIPPTLILLIWTLVLKDLTGQINITWVLIKRLKNSFAY
ncbi:hypothetical protein RDI58_007351 [Solanum bulbocastanum]|uniref:Transposase-associated domain-containing protein n=1 Tax=Solanum bulbocastanum TaxID=147425 RepID=A0AAN8U054_SOLBU